LAFLRVALPVCPLCFEDSIESGEKRRCAN
jgi:hypothetical protein